MSLKRNLTKRMIGPMFGLVLLGMSACQFPSSPFGLAPSPTPQPVVGVDELQFKDPETGQRFRALDRCIAGIVDDTWRTTSYQLIGNFYMSSWCRGSGAPPGCEIAYPTRADRDQHIVRLYTLFYPQGYPQVFGLGLQALWLPEATGWGTSFYFNEGGGGVMGEGWGVSFSEFTDSAGEPAAMVHIGRAYSYDIYETTVDDSPALPMRDDLALYLASPEAMRDRGLAQIRALAEKVKATISAHQVTACDRGPYLGRGIPPTCRPRPLTPAEETAELARAEAYFADQEQLLQDHYREMYAAWLLAFPLDRCTP
jgi:hypothetical protein